MNDNLIPTKLRMLIGSRVIAIIIRVTLTLVWRVWMRRVIGSRCSHSIITACLTSIFFYYACVGVCIDKWMPCSWSRIGIFIVIAFSLISLVEWLRLIPLHFLWWIYFRERTLILFMPLTIMSRSKGSAWISCDVSGSCVSGKNWLLYERVTYYLSWLEWIGSIWVDARVYLRRHASCSWLQRRVLVWVAVSIIVYSAKIIDSIPKNRPAVIIGWFGWISTYETRRLDTIAYSHQLRRRLVLAARLFYTNIVNQNSRKQVNV